MQLLHSVRRPSSSLRALPLALVIAAALPTAGAQAQGCTGAPGASALEQYCEAVPRADGGRDRPSTGSGSGSGSGGGTSNGSTGSGSGVSRGTAEQLSAAGRDGAAVERLAGGTAEGSSQGSSKSKKSGAKTSGDKSASGSASGSDESGSGGDAGAVKGIQVDGPAEPSGSPLKAATKAVASGPTAGDTLVWGLVGISALGAAGAVFLRRGQRLDPLDGENDPS